MVTSKIAINNLFSNVYLIVPYLLIMSFFSGLLYVLINLLYNSSIYKLLQENMFSSVLILGVTIVFLLTLFFGQFANHSLNDECNKKMNVLFVLGMGKRKIYHIMFVEKTYLFLANTIIGTVFGTCYNTVSSLLIRKLLDIQSLKIQYCFKAWLWTVFILLIIYLLVYISAYRNIKFGSVLIPDSNNNKQLVSKFDVLFGIIGIFCLMFGYFNVLKTCNITMSLKTFLFSAVLVFIGTLGTISSGIILFMNLIKKSKRIYYNSHYYFFIAGMTYRLRNNAIYLGIMCILTTVTLVVISVMVSLYIEKNSIIDSLSPMDITSLSANNVENTLKNVAIKNNIELVEKGKLTISQSMYGDLNKNRLTIHTDGGITNDYQITVVSLSSFNTSNNTHYKLKDNEIMTYVPNKNLNYSSYMINGETFRNVQQIKRMDFIFSPQRSIMPNFFIITNNQRIEKKIVKSKPHILQMEGYMVKGDTSHKIKFYNKLRKINFYKTGANVVEKNVLKTFINILFGGFLFLGIILGVVFAILNIAIIYYKQLYEGSQDQENYTIMKYLGVPSEFIKISIKTQINFTFAIPILFALLNFVIFMPILFKIMSSFCFYDLSLFIKIDVICFVVYTIFYSFVCQKASNMYYRLMIKI
ncbi:MAG: FtsX-like permease family protein [Lactobacillaceae bacterium]